MVQHLVAHAAKTAVAFLDAVKVRETLSQQGIARTGAVLALAQALQRDRRRRQAGTRDDHTVGKNLEHEFADQAAILCRDNQQTWQPSSDLRHPSSTLSGVAGSNYFDPDLGKTCAATLRMISAIHAGA